SVRAGYQSQTTWIPVDPRRRRRRGRGRGRALDGWRPDRRRARCHRPRCTGLRSNGTRPALLPDDESLVGGGRIMLLTKIHDGASDAASAARPRFRRIAGARLPTMDRRGFLKRSGLVAGAGAFASQIPFNLIGKADAADDSYAKKVEVKRT